MFDKPTNQTPSSVDSDKQNMSQSFESVVKETQKPWNPSALKWSSLFCIGFLAYFLAFYAGRSLVEWKLVLMMVLGVVLIIALPILYLENARITRDRPPHICEYISAFTFVGVAITPVLAGWIGRTTNTDLIMGLGALVIIFIPLLYIENARVSCEPSYGDSETRVFINALIFVGLAIIT